MCLNKQRGMLFICLNLVNKFANVRAFERKRLSYEMQIAEYIVHCAIKWWKKKYEKNVACNFENKPFWMQHSKQNEQQKFYKNKYNCNNSNKREREIWFNAQLSYFKILFGLVCALLIVHCYSIAFVLIRILKWKEKKNRWQDYFE